MTNLTKSQRKIAKYGHNHEHIKNVFMRILVDAQTHIIRQGGGVNIPRYGAAYQYEGKRDVIAGILPPTPKFKNSFMWESIESESLKWAVNSISKKYGYNQYGVTNDPKFLREFLRDLQDIHDESFDEYYSVDGDRLSLFLSKCEKLKKTIQEF